MIRITELNPRGVRLNRDQRYNLHLLHTTVNEIRHEWGQPIIVNSGVRTMEEHLQIYRDINLRREARGMAPIRIPLQSAHLAAAAADLRDETGMLWHFIEARFDYWESLDLDIYLESKLYTPNFVHLQVIPPKSGNRIFVPY